MFASTIRVAIAYHSGFGHTARQAEAVAYGAASVPGVLAELHNVAELTDDMWAALDRADAIIFGSPTYMGNPSAAFKAFAEGTSKVWADQMHWKDKIAAGFTNSQNIHGDKLNSLIDFVILAAQHGMHWVSLGLYPGWNTSIGSSEDLNRLGSFLGAMAQSNGDAGPEFAPPKSDLETAEALGRRVALVTQQWVRGRERSEEETLEEEQQACTTASVRHERDAQSQADLSYVRERALIGTPETIRRRLAAYEQAGAQEMIVYMPDAATLESVRLFARACMGT